MTVDRLTALDASFVWLEHPHVPIHVGAVATFEAAPLLDERGALRLGELRARIDARLVALPRLRRRLALVPFDLDRPRWVDDPDFDIARHVREVHVPAPGDDDALRALAGRLQAEVLPRDRPLWDLCFVAGLTGDRVGLIERVHHSLVDGVSGVDLATVLLDVARDAPAPPPPPPWSPGTPPDPAALLVDGVRTRLVDAARVAGGIAQLVRHPSRAVPAVGVAASGLAALAGEGLLAPRTSLEAIPTGARRLAWVRAPLEDVRGAARPAGASVNDVVLSGVAGGLRSLLLARGEPLPTDLVLKVLVPVSLRRAQEHGTLGNRVGAIFAPLPVGIGDPAARLAAVAAGTRRLKAGAEGDTAGLLLDGIDAVPAPAARLLTRAVDHQRLVNLVVTNVPGPPVPLYAAGARMLEAYPVVPLGANLSVGVAVLSYDGTLAVSLTADAAACPDVEVFADGIARSLAQLGVGGADRVDGQRAVRAPRSGRAAARRR